jgi:hypothetical protein
MAFNPPPPVPDPDTESFTPPPPKPDAFTPPDPLADDATPAERVDFAGQKDPEATVKAVLDARFGGDTVQRFASYKEDGTSFLKDKPAITDKDELQKLKEIRGTAWQLLGRWDKKSVPGILHGMRGAIDVANDAQRANLAPVQQANAELEAWAEAPLQTWAAFGLGAAPGGAALGVAERVGPKVAKALAGKFPKLAPWLGVGAAAASGIAAQKVTELGIHQLAESDTAAGRSLRHILADNPDASKAGALASILVPAGAAAGGLAKAANVVRQAEGAGAAAKFVAGRAGVGAGAGLGIDAALHAGSKAMGAEEGDYTAQRGFEAAALGAIMSGLGIKVRNLEGAEAAGVVDRVNREIAAGAQPGTTLDATTGKPVNSPADVEVWRSVGERLAAMKAKGDTFVSDPAKFRLAVKQALQGEAPIGAAAVETGPIEPSAAKGPKVGFTPPPPVPDPAPGETPAPGSELITRGADTTVFGSKGAELPAVYAWAPTSAIETSHSGEMMAPNPRYALENTRDYSAPEERDKQLAVLNGFDPRRHVTDAGDASVGPSLIATVTDESGNTSLQRLGGNNRGYAIANLAADKRQALRTLENSKAAQFGLQPTDQPDAELVRYLGEFDFRKPGERARAQGLVDTLNPSPGLIQGAGRRAAVDAATLPPERLAGLDMGIAPADAQHLARSLIAEGKVDRNLTGALAENPSQAQDYAQRLLLNAAFRNSAIAETRMDSRSAGTAARGIVDSAVPALVRMRALGANSAADAVAKTFANVLEYSRTQSLTDALDVATRQAEFDPDSIVARTVAEGLRDAVVTDKTGRPIPEPTTANARTMFEHISRAVADFNPEADLFGKRETVQGAVLRAVQHFRERGQPSASEGGSKPRLPKAAPPGTTGKPASASDAAVPQEVNDAPLVNVSGSAYAAVPLAGLPDVRIIELPEMVQLVKDLAKSEIVLKSMPKALGQFSGIGKGLVRLNPRIFQDPITAAKVLAHEIGHLVDYLPHESLKRGNLWGRLWSLKSFLKEKWTSGGPTNKQLRAELVALTQYWKPYDPATSPPSYVKYRESGVELYADFISVVFNSPATAKRLAPTFWREFWAALASKPDVKTALFELQTWLSKPFMTQQGDRRVKVDEMQALGEEAFIRKLEERQERYKGFRGMVSRLKQGFFDSFAPGRDRAAAVGAHHIEQLFDSHPMSRNEHWRWLERMQRTVVEPIEAAGFSLDDLGAHLFLHRVANESYAVSERIAAETGIATGGRTVIANPLGQTPKTARDGLLAARVRNGIKRQTLLEAGVQKFHDEVFDVMTEAHKVGLLTDEQMALIRGNRNTYAAFVPLEFVDSYVPAGIYQQGGTLKEIANPFLSTVLKVLTMQRAIQFQRLKAATVQLLRTSFPAEIQAAKTRSDSTGRKQPVPPRDPALSQIMLREAGKPAWHDVPKEIALMFEHTPLPLIESALDVLRVPFQKFFYPLFITYNPIFQYIANPIRDARRSALTGVGLGAIARQLPIIKHIGRNEDLDAVRALVKRGEQEPIIAEMLDNLAITPGEATFNATAGEPDNAFEHLLQAHGLLPADKQRWADMPVLKQIRALGEMIKTAGKINELLPKVAIYRKLRVQGGLSPADAATFVRNYIGTPNFGRRGKHVSIPNTIFPFFNIWTKGWAADQELFRKGWRPKASPPKKGAREPFSVSQSGWWLRWTMFSVVPRMLKIAAKLGLFGYGLKKLYDGIGRFDLLNYDVIPVGYIGASDVNDEGKVAYLRIPKDPVDRVLTGLMDNVVSALALKAAKAGAFGDDVKEWNANENDALGSALMRDFSIAAADVPGINPMIRIAAGWKSYLSGENPYDDFRGSHVLSDREFLAGGWAAGKEMLAWTLGQTGLQNFFRYNPNQQTTTEIALANAPVVNGIVKSTDLGYRQAQTDAKQADESKRAAAALSFSADVQRLSTEYWYLRQLGTMHRTPQQAMRYATLKPWYSGVFEPAVEALTISETGGDAVRSGVESMSRAFLPQK